MPALPAPDLNGVHKSACRSPPEPEAASGFGPAKVNSSLVTGGTGLAVNEVQCRLPHSQRHQPPMPGLSS